MNDLAKEMRATHERYEAEREKMRQDQERYEKIRLDQERRSRLFNRLAVALVGALFLFDAYVWGPSFIRAVRDATVEWRALF